MVRRCRNDIFCLIYARKVLRYGKMYNFDIDVMVTKVKTLTNFFEFEQGNHKLNDEIRNIRRLTSKISNYLCLRTLYGIILDDKYQAFDFIFDSKIFPKFQKKLHYEVFDLDLQEFVTLETENISKLLSLTNSRLCS